MQHNNEMQHGRCFIPIRSSEELQRARAAEAQANQDRLFAQMRSKREAQVNRKPIGYERPAFNTPQYWRDCAQGWITGDEQSTDQSDFEARRRRAIDSKHNKAAPPHRHCRAAPRPSKQFSKPMATQAARDDRLTPQSKALLQVLVARTGRGRFTDTTKTTLGIIMNRCPRSIQRYIQELVRFGYLRTQTIKSRRTGFFIGLRVWIMNSVLPFWAGSSTHYDPQQWLTLPGTRRYRVETEMSPIKSKNLILNALSVDKPPWFADFAFGMEHS